MTKQDRVLNMIVQELGIETVGRYPNPVYWIYNGKQISRPVISAAYHKVKKEFGIDCKELRQFGTDGEQ